MKNNHKKLKIFLFVVMMCHSVMQEAAGKGKQNVPLDDQLHNVLRRLSTVSLNGDNANSWSRQLVPDKITPEIVKTTKAEIIKEIEELQKIISAIVGR